jgi:hypothetical protein
MILTMRWHFSYLSQELDFFGYVHHASKEVDVAQSRRCAEIEGENLQEKFLHAQDLLLGVCVVCDVNEFSDLWRVDFFVFSAKSELHQHTCCPAGDEEYLRSNEHCCCPHQLELCANH